jgi:hypothetical protein
MSYSWSIVLLCNDTLVKKRWFNVKYSPLIDIARIGAVDTAIFEEFVYRNTAVPECLFLKEENALNLKYQVFMVTEVVILYFQVLTFLF